MRNKKPNILWLMSDQHNADCFGAAGHPTLRTPNLDAIARRGVRFSRAYCNNPICAPSRCTFLSGQYVKTHGISGNFVYDADSDAPNLGRLFKENGYQTAFVGKAHLPHRWVVDGFDHIRYSDLCDADKSDPQTCHYFKDLVEAGLADKYDSGLLLPEHYGYGKGSFISELPEEFSLEAWTGRNAVEFLEQRTADQPFFLKVSFQRPHDPYAPPANRADEYIVSDVTLPGNACDYFERKFAGKPQFQQDYVSEGFSGYPFRSHDPDELRQTVSRYYTLITMMDDAIGNILKTLEEQGELENTVIAYVTDHGDFAGEHGLALKNLGIYESIHRIPFLLAGPGVPVGQVCDAMIDSVDFYPTLAELAGLSCEDGMDGTSRIATARGEAAGLSHTVCEWDYVTLKQSRVHAVRDERFRFVYYDETPDDGELYDCQQDPGELNNLFGSAEYKDEQDRLAGLLRDYRKGARRLWDIPRDREEIAKVTQKPTFLLHKRGAKWSELCGHPQL